MKKNKKFEVSCLSILAIEASDIYQKQQKRK